MEKCGEGCGDSNTQESPLKTSKTLVIEEDVFEEIYKDRLTDVATIELDPKFDWVFRKKGKMLVLVPLKKEEK